MRLAVGAGVKIVFAPGTTRAVRLAPIGGARIVRGHGGLVDGGLDEPGALEAAVARAGGVTTVVAQDFGPVWNLGANPAACLRTAWAAMEAVPLNVGFLVRASSSRPEGVEESLSAGGAGLKIHEDVAAGPEQL